MNVLGIDSESFKEFNPANMSDFNSYTSGGEIERVDGPLITGERLLPEFCNRQEDRLSNP